MGVEVLLTEKSALNILSKEAARAHFSFYFIEGWGTRAVHQETGRVIDFCLDGGLTQWADLRRPERMSHSEFYKRYVSELKRMQAVALRELGKPKKLVAALTVADRARLFTKAEQKRAEDARVFVANSGYRGLDTLLKTIPRLDGCKITAQDLRNQAFIYGATSAAQAKGRTRWSAPRVMNRDGAAALMMKRDVKLLMDPMTVLERNFLIGIAKPVSLGLAVALKGTTAAQLKKGVVSMINSCNMFRLRPTEIVVDPDQGLRAAALSTGLPVTDVGPGDHVPDAESLIGVVKNIERPVVHALSYHLPPSMVPGLVYYSMRRRNTEHTSITGEIALEAVTGVHVGAQEFKIGFGDHVEVRVRPDRGVMSRMTERTRSAVALYPSGKHGVWKVMFLDTWTEGSSDRPILIPTDDAFIRRMNARFWYEKPSINYRQQLNAMRAGPPPEAEQEVGPELVEAGGLNVDELLAIDEPLPLLIEDGVVPAAEDDEEAEAAEGPANDPAEHVDDGMVRLLRSGNEYRINFVSHLGEKVSLIASMKKGATKSTIAKALRAKGARGDKAMEAAIAEVKQIDGKGSWHPVLKKNLSREERRAIVRTFMFVLDKFTPEGELLKVKARLVAMGNMQNPDNILMDVSAPTVDITSVLAMAAINAQESRKKMTCDVGGAFLHTVWPKEQGQQVVHLDRINTSILLQVRPDYQRFVQPDGCILMALDRALYGLIQSARLWYDRLTAVLRGEGYAPNPVDPCVWNIGVGSEQCTVLFHVDDLSCSSVDLAKLKALEEVLVREFGEEHINCRYGDRQEYLGMLFEYTTGGCVRVSMPGYLQAVLDYSEVDQTKTAKTPATSSLFLLKEKVPKLNAERSKVFHSLVQALSYAAQRVRWDLMTAVSFLKGRVSSPDEFDWSKLLRLLHYLNGTKELGCVLGVRGKLEIDTSIDASHAVYDDARSQGGLAMSFGYGLVKARSHRLAINTKSSAESELVTTSDNIPEVVHLRAFLDGQGYTMGPSVVRQDNQAAIRLLEKGKSDSKRTKHINTRYFFVHDRIQKGEILLQYTPTEHMVADFFTKPLQGSLFLRMRDKLLGITAFAEGCG